MGLIDSIADKLIDQLLSVGVQGVGPFDSAVEIAEKSLRHHGDAESAIDGLLREHLALVATSGFVTGLGGFVTLPVALPANIIGFYVAGTRLVAATAHLRGYDVRDDRVKSAIGLALAGDDANRVLNAAGVGAGGKALSTVTRRLPESALAVANKALGFTLIRRIGLRWASRFGRFVPVAGAVVGAGVDSYFLTALAKIAREQFPPRT